jgi:PAS domain S-box-containing protein
MKNTIDEREDQLQSEVAQRQEVEQELLRYISEMDEARDRVERQAATLIEQAEALHQGKERLDIVLQGSKDGFWDWNLRTGSAYFSPRLAEMLGYGDETVLDQHIGAWTNLIHPDDRGHTLDAWKQHIAGHTTRFENEHRLRHTTEGWKWVLVRGQVVERDANGSPRRAAGVISDVTDRKRLETELRQSQKLEAVGQLAAGITHELNTPIQYIGGNVQFLRDICRPLAALLELCDPAQEALAGSSADPMLADRFKAAIDAADLNYLRAEMPRAIEESLEGVDRVGKIVRALKEFAHPGQGEKVAVDLNHAIETTITIARNEWRYVADVVTAFDPELPPVACLIDEFNQVILNLLINASHAIEEKISGGSGGKGTITIGTRSAGDSVEIWIQDTGAGIPEAFRSRIFEPFFTTKKVGKGTGQGLSLAHSAIVRRHGGQIRFDSHVDVGTTFFVRLPIATAE